MGPKLLAKTGIFIIIICLFGTMQATAQMPKTFLYKITGNGLSKPSYLYGTIHLKDPRLFNFQDSLYSYLVQSDEFVMEINPDSIVQGMLDYQLSSRERVLIKDLMSKEEFDRIKRKYQYLSEQPFDELTLGELIYIAQNYEDKNNSGEEMPTFMDMFLMGMASDMGKSISGLERLEDQIKLFESLLSGKKPEEILATFASKKKQTEGIIQSYLKCDFSLLMKYVAQLPKEAQDDLLAKRNKIMLEGMVKLMAEKSVFTAVGAAHLPGNDGLVEMLRLKGYTVTPELSPKRTHANSYAMAKIEKPDGWQKVVVEKDGYEFLMPGNPAKNDVAALGSSMYTYVNWKNSNAYFTLHFSPPVSFNANNRDSLLKGVLQSTMDNLKSKVQKPISSIDRNGYPGYETTVKSEDNINYRLNIFGKDEDMYLLMVGMSNADSLTSVDPERFLNSFKMIPKKLESLVKYENKDYAFEVLMAGKPTETLPEELSVESKQLIFYSKRGAAEIMVLVATCNPGYEFNDDTLLISNLKNQIESRCGDRVYEAGKSILGGFPAYDIEGVSTEDIVLRVKLVHRGNRAYYIWYYCPVPSYKKEAADDFFASFNLLPFLDKPVKMEVHDGVRVAAIDGIIAEKGEKVSLDSTNLGIYHPIIASTLTVSKSEIDTLHWAASDSAYLHFIANKKEWIKTFTVVPGKSFYQNGNPVFEYSKKISTSHQFEKVRLIKAGNTIYRIEMMIDSAAEKLASVRAYFDSVSILKNHPAFNLQASGPKDYFKKLAEMDQEAFRNTLYDFNDLPFTKQDVPFLLEEVCKKMPGDTLQYPSLFKYVWEKIYDLADSTHIPLLVSYWNKRDTSRNIQPYILNTLAQIQVPEALNQVKNLFPPLFNEKEDNMNLFSSLMQRDKEYAQVFPDWYKYLDDTTFGLPMLHLYLRARDSNWVNQTPPEFEKRILLLAHRLVTKFSTGTDRYIPYSNSIIEALQQFRTLEANAILNELAVEVTDMNYFRLEAAMALIENGEKPVQAIEKLAALPDYRATVYLSLKEKNELDLFPKKYLNREAMAEAYLYLMIEDDYPDIVESQGWRTATFNGKKYQFYVYKLGFTYEGKTEYYLGIAGPFTLTGTSVDLALEDDYLGGVTGYIFDKKKIDKQLAEYLAEMEPPPVVEMIEE